MSVLRRSEKQGAFKQISSVVPTGIQTLNDKTKNGGDIYLYIFYHWYSAYMSAILYVFALCI